jgi:transcription-repair coupling factor (superfamily II helicase)
MRMLDEAVAELEGDDEVELEPIRIEIPVDAYVPGDYVDYERGKIDIHRRIASAGDVATLEELRLELSDRFGEPPDPLARLFDLQRMRIRFAEAGIREAVFRAGRITVGPLDLDSAAYKDLRGRVEGVVYESGRQTVACRVPDEPTDRLAASLELADALAATVSLPTA